MFVTPHIQPISIPDDDDEEHAGDEAVHFIRLPSLIFVHVLPLQVAPAEQAPPESCGTQRLRKDIVSHVMTCYVWPNFLLVFLQGRPLTSSSSSMMDGGKVAVVWTVCNRVQVVHALANREPTECSKEALPVKPPEVPLLSFKPTVYDCRQLEVKNCTSPARRKSKSRPGSPVVAKASYHTCTMHDIRISVLRVSVWQVQPKEPGKRDEQQEHLHCSAVGMLAPIDMTAAVRRIRSGCLCSRRFRMWMTASWSKPARLPKIWP